MTSCTGRKLCLIYLDLCFSVLCVLSVAGYKLNHINTVELEIMNVWTSEAVSFVSICAL